MLRKHKRLIFFLLLKLIPISALAGDTIVSLNGESIYRELQADYYFAKLLANPISEDFDQLQNATPAEMHLVVLVDGWSKRRFIQHWNQAIFLNNPSEERAKYAAFLEEWAAVIEGRLEQGDEINFKKTEKHFVFSINDVVLMKSNQRDGFNLLLNTWIGPKPPSSEFKTDILGTTSLTDNPYELLARSDKYDSRKKEIRSWLTPPEKAVSEKTKSKKVANEPPTSIAAKTESSLAKLGSAATEAPSAAESAEKRQVDSSSTNKATSKAPVVQESASPPTTTSKTLQTASLEASNTTASAAANSASSATIESPAKTDKTLAGQVQQDIDAPTLAATDTPQASEPIIPAATEQASVEQSSATSEKTPDSDAEDPLLKVYRSNIMTLTYQNLIYPSSAIDRGYEGKVMVTVTVNRKGKVVDLQFDEESRYKSLNRAVKKAVSSANPFPAVPRKLRGKELKLTIPIVFSLSS